MKTKYYSQPDTPSINRGNLDSYVNWAAKDLGVPKPQVKFFTVHQSERLFMAACKAGDNCHEHGYTAPAGFHVQGEKCIYLRSNLLFKGFEERLPIVVFHESYHYARSIQNHPVIKNSDWNEEGAYGYAQEALRRYHQEQHDTRRRLLDDIGASIRKKPIVERDPSELYQRDWNPPMGKLEVLEHGDRKIRMWRYLHDQCGIDHPESMFNF